VQGKQEIVIAAPMYPPTLAALDADFVTHRLWEANDRAAFVAPLRAFWDWIDVPDGTIPVVQLHSKSFFCRFLAISSTTPCTRNSSFERI